MKCKGKVSSGNKSWTIGLSLRDYELGFTSYRGNEELRCFGGRGGVPQTDKPHLFLYILASFAECWICL